MILQFNKDGILKKRIDVVEKWLQGTQQIYKLQVVFDGMSVAELSNFVCLSNWIRPDEKRIENLIMDQTSIEIDGETINGYTIYVPAAALSLDGNLQFSVSLLKYEPDGTKVVKAYSLQSKIVYKTAIAPESTLTISQEEYDNLMKAILEKNEIPGDLSVTTQKIADGAVTNDKIADKTIDGSKTNFMVESCGKNLLKMGLDSLGKEVVTKQGIEVTIRFTNNETGHIATIDCDLLGAISITSSYQFIVRVNSSTLQGNAYISCDEIFGNSDQKDIKNGYGLGGETAYEITQGTFVEKGKIQLKVFVDTAQAENAYISFNVQIIRGTFSDGISYTPYSGYIDTMSSRLIGERMRAIEDINLNLFRNRYRYICLTNDRYKTGLVLLGSNDLRTFDLLYPMAFNVKNSSFDKPSVIKVDDTFKIIYQNEKQDQMTIGFVETKDFASFKNNKDLQIPIADSFVVKNSVLFRDGGDVYAIVSIISGNSKYQVFSIKFDTEKNLLIPNTESIIDGLSDLDYAIDAVYREKGYIYLISNDGSIYKTDKLTGGKTTKVSYFADAVRENSTSVCVRKDNGDWRTFFIYPENANAIVYCDKTTFESDPFINSSRAVPQNKYDISTFQASGSNNGLNYTNNGKGTITFSGQASVYTTFNLGRVPLVQNHKYLLMGAPSGGGTSVSDYKWRIYVAGFPGNDFGEGNFGTWTSADNNANSAIAIESETTFNSPTKFTPQFYDLTEMFGEGNEPTTIEEFKSRTQSYNYLEITLSNKLSSFITDEMGGEMFSSMTIYDFKEHEGNNNNFND